jgi:hypothetical protein
MANDLSVRLATADDAAVVSELNGTVQALHHGNRQDRSPAPEAAGVTRTFDAFFASLGFSTRQRRLSAPVRRAGEG